MSLQTSQALLEKVTAALAPVAGVRAVVLGGSRGRGVHHASSDYDIGLYYDGELDIAGLERAAQALNDAGTHRSYRAGDAAAPLMTAIGGWGPWVDGGGWLIVDGEPLDILYRDRRRVERVIAESLAGRFECAYHVGHPHAFVSTIYAGEVATAQALHDPSSFVAACKAKLAPYPPALRDAAMARFADEARFFLAMARDAAGKGDVTYVAGCAFRAAACLLQAIFARNGQWLINEKGALALAAKFAVVPKDLRRNMEAAFAELASGPQGLISALGALGDLLDETVALA
ncbi:MAG TPA: nucleotidyltransferase domain-containing protein [Rhizomicrobium sp.]|jgi:hypothetical protein|nr:nucleotidyltransferase domain-containing protein [Rhizomicrobium sp.]